MSELNYSRLLQAIHIQVTRNGITKKASNALNKVMELPHPKRESAFLEWALNTDLYKQPVAVSSHRKITHDQISL